MKKLLLFDLDGTLTESAPGITKSIQYALRSLGVEGYTLEELEEFVGPPLKEMLMARAGLSAEEAEAAIGLFRERYSTVGKFENRVYDGIPELLSALREKGAVLGVASSKPELFVREILEHYGLDRYFTYVVGAAMDETRTHKAEVVAEMLRVAGAETHRQDVLMIGDTRFDVLGARQNGIAALGVAYGYGSARDMREQGALDVVHSVQKLQAWLLSWLENAKA